MPNIPTERRFIIQQKLMQSLKDFDYRFKRYKISYSITIWHSPENIDLALFSNHIRATDRFITFDRNTCAIIFDCTNDESGIKAANNLLTHYHSTFYAMPLFASIVTVSNYDSTLNMTQNLFELLTHAVKHNMNSIILEHSQVIQHNQQV
ncbi:MAG: hypothetical protein Q8K81_06510 [Sulfuricurvum sp.]|nr:hypothetical protein [Sulfuricurvum sp.]